MYTNYCADETVTADISADAAASDAIASDAGNSKGLPQRANCACTY
ncbi:MULTISPECIES: hypothetical protein [unclassified Acinetobacter]